MTEPMANTAPKEPWYMGRSRSGTVWNKMTLAPERIPEHPIPAMALPTMKTIELGAAPQTADPTSKSRQLARKTGFAG